MRARKNRVSEPSVEELLADETVQLLMLSDKVDEREFRDLICEVGKKPQVRRGVLRTKFGRVTRAVAKIASIFPAHRCRVKPQKYYQGTVWQSSS